MFNKDKVEIRLGGTGGQGLITAAIIFAEAAIKAGKNVVQTQSYGPEARGGASKAEVVISNKQIAFPKVRNADILLVMSQEAADKYGKQVAEGAIIISDSTLVQKVPYSKATHVPIPITMMAKERLGKEIVANIVALGVVAGLSGIIARSDAFYAISKRLPAGTESLNKKAFDLGWKIAQQIINYNKNQLAIG